ncbi:2-oxoacid:ferredoxin oxidoreductase subunit beta [Pinisolibacter sp.]|uniref:2-oxoacid:ferredoxin oxidoreductase subunit beta n=1 Tax=Pinisolibacter sp. TaxID=2172024 RepID=UPI002FDEAB3C
MTIHEQPHACPQQLTLKDFKSSVEPIWCSGCGDFGVLQSLQRALAELGRPPHEVVVVSGIGCSSRLPAYTTAYGFHGVHGRALPVATGIKLARPDLEVITVGGDGDGYSIGGNHFLHAARRNVDLTYIVMDNRVYGMTKGQPSPTTEADWDSDAAPGGTGVKPFSPLAIALAAGANFVARGFALDVKPLAAMIVEAVRHPGFSFIEVLSPCITFRPEEMEWKKSVERGAIQPTSDRAMATAAVLSDTEMSTGIFFKGDRGVYREAPKGHGDAEKIAAQFRVGGNAHLAPVDSGCCGGGRTL